VCSRPECQRQCRTDYHRKKLVTDTEYHQVALESQKQWREEHPDYQKQWRQQNPQRVENNRERHGSGIRSDACGGDFLTGTT
jgi:hypothetical protein